MNEPTQELLGSLADRYVLDREVGRGGMATVFLARDVRHSRPVAIKVMHPSVARAIGTERFLLEIQIAARLQHSRIVPLYDSGRLGDIPYYVMPFVDGESLRQRMQREPQMPIDDALRLTRDIASALDYAHRQSVVHRDIKPENILLQDNEAVLTDFGIAKAMSVAAEQSLTSVGTSIGTPSYMSPEQATGDSSVDGRADIYSLGVVLYEMLTGTAPVKGENMAALITRLLTERVVPLRQLRADAPEWLEHAIARALSVKPADRFPSAAQFASALSRKTSALSITDTFAAPTPWKPVAVPRFVRRRSAGIPGPAAQAPRNARPGVQAPPIPMVGRETELHTLNAALESASRGHGSVHFVVGEGGVGKSRLVAALSDSARTRHFTSVIGRAFPVESGIAYSLVADAFLPTIRALPASVLQVLTRGSVAELATLFPQLQADEVSQGKVADKEIKPRLFDAFGRFVQRLAARDPLLVTLENLHWADPSSLELLHFLARAASTHRLVILCTYDDTKRDAHPTLRAIEQSLRSIDAVRVHHIPPLTKSETIELVHRQFGAPVQVIDDFAARLHERTLGNPFFIGETIKALVACGQLFEDSERWAGWDAGDLELPVSVRDAIGEQLAHLSPDARRVGTTAAVVGGKVPYALLEMISGLDADALLHAVDELRGERLLLETEVDAQLAYEFTHPLLREVLYTELSRARARAMHGEIADALERLHGDRALSHADALAVHFLQAESPAQAARASRYLVIAGRSALDRGANREAAEALDAALSILEQSGNADPASHIGVLDLLARALQRLGDYAHAMESWTRAATIASAQGDSRRVASLERRLGIAAYWSGHYDDAIAHYGRGLHAAADDAPRTASLLLARSAVLIEVGRADEAAADVRDALKLAEATTDDALLSRAHHAFQLLAVWRGPAADAREHGELARQFAERAGDRNAAWNAEWAMAVHAGLTGDSSGLAAHLKSASAIAEELRSPVLRIRTDEVMMEYRTSTGGWDDALTFADRTIADARAFHQRTLLPRLLVWSSLLRFARGDLEIGTAHMEEAWKLSHADRAGAGEPVNVHNLVPAHVSRAAWHLAKREWPEALAVAEAGIAIADRTGYLVWAVHRLVPIAGEASLYMRDFERATIYGARLRTDSERLGHPLGMAWADACFAIMRLLKGDAKGAIAPIESAAVALEKIPFVEYGARVRRVLADAYYESGDTDSAVRELRRIHEVFAELGAKPWLDHVREKFRQLGVRPPARSVEDGVGALTPREVEIARLVAARKSNKEIGAALEISARTVGTHLSNIFGKLAVDSRGALTDFVRSGALDNASPESG